MIKSIGQLFKEDSIGDCSVAAFDEAIVNAATHGYRSYYSDVAESLFITVALILSFLDPGVVQVVRLRHRTLVDADDPLL